MKIAQILSTFVSRLVVLILIAAGTGSAQTLIYGSISGFVTDSAGGAVPGAKIRLINDSTGDRRLVQTTSEGVYRFLNVLPATYHIEAEATGFKVTVRSNLVIEVDKSAQVDLKLEIGAVSERLEVHAAAPLLDPQTSSLGGVVQTRPLQELPLNGRNPLALVALVPSVVPQQGSQTNPAGQNPFVTGNFQIGGGVAGQSQSYLDGAPLNLNYGNLLALVPTQDALAEFKVQTNSLSPEFGRTSGGVINMISRSGTNDFHGTAYEFLRNRVFNANTFFNNQAGVVRPPFVQNQYGAAVGGRILRDKLFFFSNWEGYHQRTAQSLVMTVPTAAMKAGDFSNVRTGAGALVPVYDPLTTCGQLNNPACVAGAAVLRSPFPNNMIPVSRLNQATKTLANLWGLPNAAGQAFTGVNNWVGNASSGADSEWGTGRVDYNINERHRIFGRYSIWDENTLEIDPFGTHAYPAVLTQGSPEGWVSKQAMLADTYTFSSTAVLDIRLTWLRQNYARTSVSYGYDTTQLGWPAFMNQELTTRFLPALTLSNETSFIANTGSYIRENSEDRGLGGSFTRIIGSHTLKAGGDVRIGPYNYLQLAGGTGAFGFDKTLTSSNPTSPAGGYDFATFMLGYPTSGSIPTANPVSGEQIYRDVYIQDDWRATRKLTFNLGLRYEQPGPWSERYNRLSDFLPDAVSPLAATTGLPLMGAFTLVDTTARPSRNNVNMSTLLFGPRAGLAYQLTPKTVLRMGYGLFYLPNNSIPGADPHSDLVDTATNTFVGSTNGGLTPGNLISNPFPNGLIQPAGRSNPNFESALWGTGPAAIIANTLTGNAQQWNVNIQRELPMGLFLDAAYAGSKGTHLPLSSGQRDQLPDQYLSLGSALLKQTPNPFLGLVNQGSLTGATIPYEQLLRPYPQFNGLTVGAFSGGDSIYHSLQIRMEERLPAGSIGIAYTYSKLMSYGGDTVGPADSVYTSPGVQDWNNFRGEKAPSGYDVPQRLVVSYVLDLPFGHGRRFGASLTGLANKLASGWGFEGISTFQKGFPLALTATPNTTNSDGGGERPNNNGQNAALNKSAQSRLSEWFNTADFSAPPAYTFGGVSRTVSAIRGAGVANWDTSIFKNTRLGDEHAPTLQFRAEFFNLFNRVQFGPPGLALGTPQFGVITSQFNQPRLMQLALRLSF
jgi:hypothetical protein